VDRPRTRRPACYVLADDAGRGARGGCSRREHARAVVDAPGATGCLMTEGYVHGYGSEEQERLLSQAEHWREELILSGTVLAPGTRLLEVGCGVGAVLGILGRAFPGIVLAGVD